MFNEADARVALGQTHEADALMSQYQAGLRQELDNPTVWLKAFVSLIAGRPDEAKSLAAMFAPNEFNPARQLDEAEMLRLWSSTMNGPVKDNFPGIAEYLRRNASQASTSEKSKISPELSIS